MIALVYRNQLVTMSAKNGQSLTNEDKPPRRAHLWLQRKSVAVTLVAVAVFFIGLPLELVALGAAAVLLLDRVKPEKIYRQVDWAAANSTWTPGAGRLQRCRRPRSKRWRRGPRRPTAACASR